MNKSEINIKIEKEKAISKIVDNIDTLRMILSTLTTSQLDITIGNVASGNLMKYGVFNKIVYKHIEEIKTDVAKAMDDLKEELNQLIK